MKRIFLLLTLLSITLVVGCVSNERVVADTKADDGPLVKKALELSFQRANESAIVGGEKDLRLKQEVEGIVSRVGDQRFATYIAEEPPELVASLRVTLNRHRLEKQGFALTSEIIANTKYPLFPAEQLYFSQDASGSRGFDGSGWGRGASGAMGSSDES